MLLQDKFIDHCHKLDEKILILLPHSIEMSNKYPQLQKLLEHVVRADFTTNHADDYEYMPLNPPMQQPFYDMLRVIQKKELFPNFFTEKKSRTGQKICKTNRQISTSDRLNKFTCLARF